MSPTSYQLLHPAVWTTKIDASEGKCKRMSVFVCFAAAEPAPSFLSAMFCAFVLISFSTRNPQAVRIMNALNTRLYEQYRTTMGDVHDDQEWRRPHLLSLIRRHFPADRGTSFLDLGCGAGMLLRLLKERGYTKLTGVDVSAEQVLIAHRLGADFVRQQELFTFLDSCPNDAYDFVIAFDLLEHFEPDDMLRIADHAFRILRPGGWWFIHVPNAEGVFGSLVRWADLTHCQAFTTSSIGQMARAAGFRSVACYSDRPVGSGWKGLARRVLYETMRIPFWLFWLAETGTIRTPWIASMNMIAVMTKADRVL
jgi:2-polyprenyl-3-methyl-5-hydroxy-6-metoxy-1,4-benzoquinol methylase